MTGPSDHDRAIAARSRSVAVVIVGTALAWMAMQFAGARFGVPTRWMLLVDLSALGALAWAMIVAVGIWRARRDEE